MSLTLVGPFGCAYGLFGMDSSAFQEETLDEAGVIQRVVDFFKETKQVS